MRAVLGAVAFAIVAALPGASRADAPAKRPVPAYDGRDPEPTTAGEVALWVPRIVLSPLYFTSEYLLRRPLALAIPAAERADLPNKIYDFFTFGPKHQAGFVPVGLVEFGFNPSVGVYAFWNDALFEGNDFRLHAEAWPVDWIAGSLTERVQIDARHSMQLRLSGLRRPDRVFYGLGPEVPLGHQSRFTEDRLEASALYDWRFWRGSDVEAALGARTVSLYDGHYGDDPSLGQEAATGAFPIPYGFDRGYTGGYERLRVALDTRRPWPAPGSGARLELQGEQGGDVRRTPDSGWIRYGAAATGFLDLNDHGRVVSLSMATLFADPLGRAPIPFTELVTLGGEHPMPGFFYGHLVDRSAVIWTLSYLWPIGPWLDGQVAAAIGDVFGPHLEGFRPGLLRFSGTFGLAVLGLGDTPLELVMGFGSETFESGGLVDSVRLAFGVPRSL